MLSTVSCATVLCEIENLVSLAKQEIEKLNSQPKSSILENDELIDQTLSAVENSNIRTIAKEIYLHLLFWV